MTATPLTHQIGQFPAWEALGVSADAEEVTRYRTYATYLSRLHRWTSMGDFPGLTVDPEFVDFHVSPTLTVRAYGRIELPDGSPAPGYYDTV